MFNTLKTLALSATVAASLVTLAHADDAADLQRNRDAKKIGQ
jgi:hypothetical protein